MANRNSTLRVALYARVSTKNNGQNPETQLLALRDYAQARKLEVFAGYVDIGISGSKDRRPALNQLMADARKRRFDAVLVASSMKELRFRPSLRALSSRICRPSFVMRMVRLVLFIVWFIGLCIAWQCGCQQQGLVRRHRLMEPENGLDQPGRLSASSHDGGHSLPLIFHLTKFVAAISGVKTLITPV